MESHPEQLQAEHNHIPQPPDFGDSALFEDSIFQEQLGPNDSPQSLPSMVQWQHRDSTLSSVPQQVYFQHTGRMSTAEMGLESPKRTAFADEDNHPIVEGMSGSPVRGMASDERAAQQAHFDSLDMRDLPDFGRRQFRATYFRNTVAGNHYSTSSIVGRAELTECCFRVANGSDDTLYCTR
ncbi:hypothetical protein HDU96_001174 [Phlyctochytrium bullatum]|nr:hypothetical protein HDU96_001174 [Phlyctochytrium bullatum]